MEQPTDSVVWSPPKLVDKAKIKRLYFQRRSSQRKSLDRRDAWTPINGIPNIPPEILEDARKRNLERSQLTPQTEGKGSFRASSPAPHGDKESAPDNPASEADRESDAEEEDSGPGTQISWPSSPSQHYRRPSPPGEVASLSLPTKAPSRPRSTAVSRFAYMNNCPSSSTPCSDIELEVQVPGAVTDILEPVNPETATVLEPTPPSAQIIPCSLTGQTSPVRTPGAKRRRLMKRPAGLFQTPGLVDRRPAAGPPAIGADKTDTFLRSQSPSPIIASTPPVVRTPLPLPVKEGHSLAAKNKLDASAAVARNTAPQVSKYSQGELLLNSASSQDPFAAFKAAYPEYDGDLHDYVRGIMCISRLGKKRALSPFLYDDFLRVFSGDYIDYVASLNGEERALTAIQWYNENVPRPLYTKEILSVGKIGDILDHYADQVRVIQQSLEMFTEIVEAWGYPTTSRERQRQHSAGHYTSESSSATFKSEIRHARTSSDTTRVAEVSRPLEDQYTTADDNLSRLAPARLSDRAVPRSINTRKNAEPVLSSPQNQARFPSSTIEQTRAPRIPETRTFGRVESPWLASGMPSATLTQTSNPESIAEPTRKRRLKLSDQPGATFKKPKKAKKDLAMRDEDTRIKNFLTRHKIAQSSAPRSSAASKDI